MTEKLCPNCEETMATCSGSYSQGCWQRRADKTQAKLDKVLTDVADVVLSHATDQDRIEDMADRFAAVELCGATVEPTLPLVYSIRVENLWLLIRYAKQALEPLKIAGLYCPVCRTRHIDEGEFATKRHHTHACQGFVEDNGKRRRCGHVWRPALTPTVGVEALPGFINEEKPDGA